MGARRTTESSHHHGEADLARGLVDLAVTAADGRPAGEVLPTAVRHPATSVLLAADLAAILDPGTPAFQHLPRLPEEIR
ncbi:hypothetical protein [Geodermatophilus siccatus]|uniref:hypothetical protein n=1 Tax=Geodermatophilus siccatus TaxID=1137991 RepID=UPI000B8604C0|nr:hypothetical protein [Geodermatophilus siccatus]